MKTIKLCDFGISTSLDKTRRTNKANLGTPAYMPPEHSMHILTSRFDIWSLGCVLLQILSGKEPFYGVKEEFQIHNYLFVKKLTPLSYLLLYKPHLLNGMPDSARFNKTLFACEDILRDFL